jgi:hypothetical protein
VQHPTSSSSSGVAGSGTVSAGVGVSAGPALGPLEAAVQAAAAAAAVGPRATTLRCFHAQDLPYMQQLWYIHDAMQLFSTAAAATAPPAAAAATTLVRPGSNLTAPPVRPDCRQHSHQQQLQQEQWPPSGSSGSSAGSSGRGRCECDAVLEVVSRPPDSSGRNPDLKVNRNLLLLLLHHAGVPLQVFEE